jgi:hypothetical protein
MPEEKRMEDWLKFMFSRADALVQRAASRPRLPRPAAARSYHAQRTGQLRTPSRCRLWGVPTL